MNVDWEEVDKQNSKQSQHGYKDYAPNGEYKVKLDHVEIRDNDKWKSPAMTFWWKETADHKFPKTCTHWLSIPKPTYRQGHNLNILKAFGIEEAKAKELIEAAERDQDRIKLVKGYEALYKRIAERGAEVEITVHDQYDRDGNVVTSPSGTVYSESDFKAWGCRTANRPKKATVADKMGDDEEIDLNEIPF